MEQTMQELYRPSSYPEPIRSEFRKARPLMVEIANRWMLGWPKRVKGLIASGEYLDALKLQTEQEMRAISAPGMNHLARHEMAHEYGLSLEPPEP
jgi:hypothetical protein